MTNLSDTLAALSEAANWLRECSDWLLSNDLDMTCPMQTDPLDLAEALDAIRTGQLVPVPSVERVAEGLREGLRSASKAPPGLRVKALVATIEQAIAAMQEGRDG